MVYAPTRAAALRARKAFKKRYDPWYPTPSRRRLKPMAMEWVPWTRWRGRPQTSAARLP